MEADRGLLVQASVLSPRKKNCVKVEGGERVRRVPVGMRTCNQRSKVILQLTHDTVATCLRDTASQTGCKMNKMTLVGCGNLLDPGGLMEDLFGPLGRLNRHGTSPPWPLYGWYGPSGIW